VPVYIPQAELEKTLAAYGQEMIAGPYQAGLFQAEITLSPTLELADITPCDFSGYDGLRDLDQWPSSPDWIDPRAILEHPEIEWEHDGGAVSNPVFGFYVVDGDGLLAWVDTRSDGAVTVGVIGQTYTITPKYTRRSEESA